MNTLKILNAVLSGFGVVCGLASSYYWYAASKVLVSPAWELEIHGDVNKNIMGWVTGNMVAFKRSGDLNKLAALWTAATVALSTVAWVLSIFASNPNSCGPPASMTPNPSIERTSPGKPGAASHLKRYQPS